VKIRCEAEAIAGCMRSIFFAAFFDGEVSIHAGDALAPVARSTAASRLFDSTGRPTLADTPLTVLPIVSASPAGFG
jgi:hypothetical protein